MAKKGDDDWLIGLLIGGIVAGGLVLLYHSQTGKGDKDSALLPKSVEDPIDKLIGLLNARFGPRWLEAGMWAIRVYLQGAAPGLLKFVDTVAAVEERYKYVPKSGPTKKQEVMRVLAAQTSQPLFSA